MKKPKNNELSVDICAALLTQSPPRLPLREELPSLGFEVIYHAAGVGIKASKHEAYKAARSFRRQEEVKELKKRRFFPKSSKRIKEKLAERKRKELELRQIKNAISYEAYQRELQQDHSGDTGSSSGDSSNMSATASDTTLSSSRQLKEAAEKLRKEQVKRRWGQSVRKNRTFGLLKTDESKSPPPKMVEFYKQGNVKLEGIFGQAVFPDYLAPLDTAAGGHSETAATTTPKSSTVKSNDPSTITTPQHSIGRPQHIEFQFGSPSSFPYLPALNTVAESVGSQERVDESKKNGIHTSFDAFKSIGSFPDLLEETDEGGASDNQAQFSPPSTRTATSKDPSSISTPVSMEKKRIHNTNVQFVVTSAAPGINLPGLEVDGSGAPKTPTSGTTSQIGPKSSRIVDKPPAIMESVKNAFASLSAQKDIYSSLGFTETRKDKKTNAFAAQTQEMIPQEENFKGSDKKTSENKITSPAEPTTIETFANATMTKSDGGFWLTSAKLAIESIASDMLNLVGGIGSDIEMETIDEFFSLLEKPSAMTRQVEPTLAMKPEFVQTPRELDSRLALHVLCARGLPDRSSEKSTETAMLVQDISDFKDLLLLVQGMNPTACEAQDFCDDLPVHILARALMQWEAQWYDSVYKQAGHDNESKGDIAGEITKLYESMSQCIEVLLKPVAKQAPLCHLSGSVGSILPLHIASIFTTSIPTLRMVLEAYPDAATIPCDLGNLQTLVPDKTLPLELHIILSTDFPKWETETRGDSNPEIKWSQSKMVDHGFEDCIRRSDLLFAYNPIEPYTREKSRIRRLESRIQYEAKHAIEENRMRPSQASELVWTWFCTVRDPKSKSAPYLSSVKRIVEMLPLRSVQILASVATKSGQLVIDAAAPECSSVIRRRMERVTETIVPIASSSTMGSSEKTKTSSPTLKNWEATQLARLSTTEKGLVKHVCGLIFNLHEVPYPTSFVILPYKLKLLKDGKTGIESADFASAAIRFADHLLQLTDPRSILYFLDRKSKNSRGISLYGDEQDGFRLSHYQKIKEQEESLMELYSQGPAYLYLIDEATGIPNLTGTKKEYPIVLEDSGNILRKVLPLMLLGMLHMRGEKALSVLISVLLDDSIKEVPEKWIDAAKEIAAYLYSQKARESETLSSTDATTDDLLIFMSDSMNRQRRTKRSSNSISTSEWEVELSILKTLLDMNDPERSFSGLKQKQESNGLPLWTNKASFGTAPGSRSNTPFVPIGFSRSDSVDLQAMEKDAHLADKGSNPVERDQLSALTKERHDRLRAYSGPVNADDSIASRQTSEQAAAFLNQKKSHPIDIDIIDDIIREDRRIQRNTSDPVDLDESIASSKSSGPAIEELSRKHDELSHLYGSVKSAGNTTAPLGFPQPQEDDIDEFRNQGLRQANPLRIIKSAYSDDISSDDDFILHAHTLPGLESLSTMMTAMDDTERKKKVTRFSVLFDDLAITEREEEDEGRQPVCSKRQTLDEGERVWNDISSHLDHSEILCEDLRVLHLKVSLSKEAENLSRLSRRVHALEESSKSCFFQANEAELEWNLDGFNYAARTRKLLLRLSDLEDRILASQIGLQHTALETFVMSENLKSLIAVPCAMEKDSREAPTKMDGSLPVDTFEDAESNKKGRQKCNVQKPDEAIQKAVLRVDEKTNCLEYDDRPPMSIEFEKFEFKIPDEEVSTTSDEKRECESWGRCEI